VDDLRDARHLGRDRKTIRAYLAGRQAGVRARSSPDAFEPFAAYVRQRLTDDPHLWASTLFDELVDLGYDRSYPSLTRALRSGGVASGVRAVRAGQVAAGRGDRASGPMWLRTAARGASPRGP